MNAGDEMVRGLGEVLRPHFTERDYEQGCTLACGYDGDDRVEHLAEALAAHVLGLVAAGKAEAWDEALAAVGRGVIGAQNAHAERGHRDIVSALVGLEGAIPRTENPYRADGLAGEAS